MKNVQKLRPLHQRIIAMRRVAPLAILALAGLHQLGLWFLQRRVLPVYHPWLAVALYGLSGGLVVWFVLDWLAKKVAQHDQTESELRAAHENLAETHRQLLAVHDIGRQIASAPDIQQVLEVAARAPSHLMGAVGSTYMTFDEDRDRLKLDMAWGLSDTYLAGLRRRVAGGIPTGSCRQCSPLKARVSDDCPLFEGLEALAGREGIQSLVCLPLISNQKRDGIISAYFPSPDGPPEQQIQLLNIVATEIAAALDGARLRTSQMATLYAVENLTQAQQDLDDLLAQVLAATLAGWDTCGGAILLYNDLDAAWHHWTQQGLEDSFNHPHFELALHLAEEVRRCRQPILIPQLSQHPAWTLVKGSGPNSAAVAPLMVSNELLGALVMISGKPKLFQPRQASFFSAIAHQAALAINNAQLYAQVQEMAVLEERYRLSREIHDGLAQTLSSLGWHLDHLATLLTNGQLDRLEKGLASSRRMVREAYMNVREAIDGLRLQSEHEGGMAAALQEYIADFEDRTGIGTSLEIGTESVSFSAETELQLMRIVQEALVNTRKHGSASHVWVRLQTQENKAGLTLTIADDGCGFDPALPRGRKHLGLSTMRERAQSQGGDFSVVTGPKQGTRITVTLPA